MLALRLQRGTVDTERLHGTVTLHHPGTTLADVCLFETSSMVLFGHTRSTAFTKKMHKCQNIISGTGYSFEVVRASKCTGEGVGAAWHGVTWLHMAWRFPSSL